MFRPFTTEAVHQDRQPPPGRRRGRGGIVNASAKRRLLIPAVTELSAYVGRHRADERANR